MRYYDHANDMPRLLQLGEQPGSGFPRLSSEGWNNFLARKENHGGQHFLIEERDCRIETLVCVSIKASPLFRPSAYLSIWGAFDADTLADALAMSSEKLDVGFFQCKLDDLQTDHAALYAACGFVPYEQERYMSARLSRSKCGGTCDVALHAVQLPHATHELTFIARLHDEAFAFDISYTQRDEDFFECCLVSGDEFFVIRHCGQDAGYLHLEREGTKVWLDCIALAQPYRGKGIGLAAMRALPVLLESDLELTLGVSSRNTRAIRLYEKLGLTVTRSDTRLVLQRI